MLDNQYLSAGTSGGSWQSIPTGASRTAPDVVADMKGAVDILKRYRARAP
jgi:hypothetical protein